LHFTKLVKYTIVPPIVKPENAFLVIGRGKAMRERFGDIMQPTIASIPPFILETSNLGFFQFSIKTRLVN
jgi:hypothetical protein